MNKESRIIKVGMVTAEVTRILDKLRDLYKHKTLIPRYDVSAMPESALKELLIKLNEYNVFRSPREYYKCIEKFNNDLVKQINDIDDKILNELCGYIKERRTSTSEFGVSLSTIMYIIKVQTDLINLEFDIDTMLLDNKVNSGNELEKSKK